jgi:hypothetical protein
LGDGEWGWLREMCRTFRCSVAFQKALDRLPGRLIDRETFDRRGRLWHADLVRASSAPDVLWRLSGDGAMTESHKAKGDGWSWWYLLFAIEFLLVLWPPIYNRAEPSWAGIPFFYWYQLLCVFVGAALTAIVYVATRRRHRDEQG